jgi:putative transposase
VRTPDNPEHIRSDNEPEMTAKLARQWINPLGTKTPLYHTGTPLGSGYSVSFNGRMKDKLLSGELF